MTILPTPYNVYVDPGGTAQVPTQSTADVHSQLQYENPEYCHRHDNHNKMDAALKTMILESLDSTYIYPYMTSSQDIWGH